MSIGQMGQGGRKLVVVESRKQSTPHVFARGIISRSSRQKKKNVPQNSSFFSHKNWKFISKNKK